MMRRLRQACRWFRRHAGDAVFPVLFVMVVALFVVSGFAIGEGIERDRKRHESDMACRHECTEAGHFDFRVRDGECWCSAERWVRVAVDDGVEGER